MSDEEKRRRIVDGALHVVARHGVQGATTARIAAAVGVSEPTLYRTFRNRKDMLLAAADKIWEQRRGEMESFDAVDAMDFLRQICAHHTEGIQKTRVVRFLTELAVAPEGVGPREHIRDLQYSEVQHLAGLIDQGKAEGCIRADVDTQEAAWRIMAVYWLEAMARLHGLEQYVLTGFSTRQFEDVLSEIAAQPLETELEADPAAAVG